MMSERSVKHDSANQSMAIQLVFTTLPLEILIFLHALGSMQYDNRVKLNVELHILDDVNIDSKNPNNPKTKKYKDFLKRLS